MEKSVTYGSGQVIFRQGDAGGDLFFIQSGKVKLLVKDNLGNEVVVASLGSSSVIGTMSFLEDDVRSATAVAETEVKCLKISRAQRDKLLQDVPRWLRALIKDLSVSLRNLNHRYLKASTELKSVSKRYESLKKRSVSLDDEEDNPKPDSQETF